MHSNMATPEYFEERYRLIRQLGAGGMGVVYEAEDELLKKIVAIKTIKTGILSSMHVLRFQREANALAALKHPSLVPLYIFGISKENEPYMVMQYEPGKSLSEIIEDRGRLPVYKSVNMFIQICDAMQHAHAQGVLHRDLKPGNIIIRNIESENPQLVVIDFGIAMVEDGSKIDFLTKTGMLLGTPTYMSPEQIRGHAVDARSDIYALGCMMFHTLTGKLPFEAPSVLELLSLKTSGAAAPKLNSTAKALNFPKGLEEIVAKAIAFSPDDRYQTMDELKEDLIAYKQGDYIAKDFDEELFEKEVPVEPSESKQPNNKLKQLAFVAIGLFLFASGGVVVYVIANSQPKQPPASAFKIPTTVVDDRMPIIPPDKIPQSVINMAEERREDDGVLEIPPGETDDEAAIFLQREKDRSYTKVSAIETKATGTCFAKTTLNIESITSINSKIDDDGLETISRLPLLKELVIQDESGFSPQGIAHLRNAEHLERLELRNSRTDFGKIREIAKLTGLKSLNLQRNNTLTDSLFGELLRGSLNLRSLDISETGVGAKGLDKLNNLKGLKVLAIRILGLNDNNIANLPQLPDLEDLDVRANNITDQGLLSLARFKKLKVLRTDSRRVTLEAKKELQRKIPGLSITDKNEWDK